MNGDILSPDLGLSQNELNTLRQEVNVVIHSASSINLAKPLSGLSDVIIGASERIAGIALTCPNLDRFVYLSTGYCNSHLPPTGDGIKVELKEDIYDPNPHPNANVMKEWAQVQESGTSDAYKAHDFPWSYAYAKNLTERLLLYQFAESGVKDKLLIVRPSTIGPAQNFPYPGYNVPLSSPLTTVAAIIALSPAGMVTVATKAVEKASQAFIDEVPVDVVADRVLVHLVIGTNGCVHAVVGKRGQHLLADWWKSALSLRRLPGKLELNWKKLDWKSNEQHPLPRFYVVFGFPFEFHDDKTVALIGHPLVESCKGLQLFTESNFGKRWQSRAKGIYSVMNIIAKRDEKARQSIKLYYQDFMKAKL
ncbi:hypothetical protein PENVUL_c038G02267 [Penicillium vulpinum]|uniref:Fatty acyl-CoA reductase n=2 Tax=Penicillium vulpinum TaxID=29845 RepID=A0A1V6RLQ5_9EURO|nr:hypothetical protein PENVUL_c038G02267 [Penicillium vulpinum]